MFSAERSHLKPSLLSFFFVACQLFLNLKEVLDEMEKLVEKGDMKRVLEIQKVDDKTAGQHSNP